MQRTLIGAALAAMLSLAAAAVPSTAQAQGVTAATLLDRVQIEDLVTDYYANLGGGDPASFGRYFTEDAELDVNGLIYRGHEAIEGLYRELGRNSPTRNGTFHMLLSNPHIVIRGDSATAQFLWTGIINDTAKAPPRLLEQGREYDALVKRNGAWKIRRRVVIADSGLPDFFEKTYTPRRDFSLDQPPAR